MKTKRRTKTTVAHKPESKLEQLTALLAEGATISQIGHKLGWQPHSVRGAISSLRKKKALKVTSDVIRDGERIYRISE